MKLWRAACLIYSPAAFSWGRDKILIPLSIISPTNQLFSLRTVKNIDKMSLSATEVLTSTSSFLRVDEDHFSVDWSMNRSAVESKVTVINQSAAAQQGNRPSVWEEFSRSDSFTASITLHCYWTTNTYFHYWLTYQVLLQGFFLTFWFIHKNRRLLV